MLPEIYVFLSNNSILADPQSIGWNTKLNSQVNLNM